MTKECYRCNATNSMLFFRAFKPDKEDEILVCIHCVIEMLNLLNRKK